MQKKKVVILGAGVAGLTAAKELLSKSDEYEVILIEEESQVGGIARTLEYKGNRIDIGGHRFFSKNEEIMEWWQSILPIQGQQSKDDIILNTPKKLNPSNPNPETEDNLLLIRRRVSRILFLRKFFDYPISLKASTFTNMGLIRTIKAGFGYLYSQLFKQEEISLEDFMINRFGKSLYQMFFRDYTEKVWGRPPAQIGADWGEQRIKGLSLWSAIKNAFSSYIPHKSKQIDISQQNKETSLIENFIYPKYGPGQLWEEVAHTVEVEGGKILLNTKVVDITKAGNSIKSITIESSNCTQEKIEADIFISSLPISDLFKFMGVDSVPANVYTAAIDLPYRDFITVGILVDKLKLKNKTKLPTVNNIIPDTWLYIQESDVKLGRIQVFNNWSPYLVKDYPYKIWLGLEYFCKEGDDLWNMTEQEFISFAKSELVKLDIVDEADILDAVQFKIKKAYPAYFDTYKDIPAVIEYLNTIENLYCIGRNGQHRYNNMDHSMLTAFKAVDCILNQNLDRSEIWKVNTEKAYHEAK